MEFSEQTRYLLAVPPRGQCSPDASNLGLRVNGSNSISLIRPYMPELDSVRGIAVLMVLFLHGVAPPIHGNLTAGGSFCCRFLATAALV